MSGDSTGSGAVRRHCARSRQTALCPKPSDGTVSGAVRRHSVRSRQTALCPKPSDDTVSGAVRRHCVRSRQTALCPEPLDDTVSGAVRRVTWASISDSRIADLHISARAQRRDRRTTAAENEQDHMLCRRRRTENLRRTVRRGTPAPSPVCARYEHTQHTHTQTQMHTHTPPTALCYRRQPTKCEWLHYTAPAIGGQTSAAAAITRHPFKACHRL